MSGGTRRYTGGDIPDPPKATLEELDLSGPIELVALAVKERAVSCRLLGSDRVVTLRATGLWDVVPGEIVTVRPSKRWRFGGHPYLSGEIEGTRLDVAALGLAPLRLEERGVWDPAEAYWGEEDEPIEDWAQRLIALGPRPQFEMERVIPGEEPVDSLWDSIIESNDLKESGDRRGAERILQELCQADLTCLDAHAHLGNLVLDVFPERALRHYEVGLRIGELSLAEGFDDVLQWGFIDNRPFLRCLHGFGLALWRLGRFDGAARVFDRMLRLNPSDNQGVRFLIGDVRAGIPWEEDAGAFAPGGASDTDGEVTRELITLSETPPWEWPRGAGELLLEILEDRAASLSDRLLAAELAGDFTIIEDEIAETLLSVVSDQREHAPLRVAAAISLGPGLEHADMMGFDDPEDILLSGMMVREIHGTLRRLYFDADVPDEVRRGILEAAVRFPEPWHPDAVRAAYHSGEEAWELTAVFCMRFLPGFEERIVEALESENQQIHFNAVQAAGAWGVDAAWWHVHELVTAPGTEKSLLIAAIYALASIRSEDAWEILDELSDSEDEEIADAVFDALGWVQESLDEYEDDEPPLDGGNGKGGIPF